MRRKGFTLIELLVVISIIALLLSIMMPALTKVKEAGRRAVCMTRAKGLTTAIYAYATKNNDNLPSTTEEMNSAWNNWVYAWNPSWPNAGPASSGWYALGLLHKTNLVEEGEAFYCPSQKHESLDPDLYFPAKSFAGVSGKLPRNYSTSGGTVAMGSLSYGLTGQVTPGTGGVTEADRNELAIQNSKIYNLKERPLVTDVFIPLKHRGVYKSSFAHTGKKGGLTVAFGDGSVDFVKLDKIVFDLAMEQRAYDGGGTPLHMADLFAATMMKLVCNQPKYMEKYFNGGNPIPIP